MCGIFIKKKMVHKCSLITSWQYSLICARLKHQQNNLSEHLPVYFFPKIMGLVKHLQRRPERGKFPW